MSVCAVAMVRDEQDVIRYWVEHTATQVDALIVADNLSTDGTRELLDELADDYPLTVVDDPEPGYFQSEKMSVLAAQALAAGHTWAVAMDADEHWSCGDYTRPIRDFLDGLAPDIRVVTADLFNHIPTALDPPSTARHPLTDEALPSVPNPFERIGWRKRECAPLPKVCARLCDGLLIRQGNHASWMPGPMPVCGGLVVRHYSWRSREQYAHKIEVGARAYAATDLPEGVGTHWRMFGLPPDDPAELAEWRERVGDHFETWFYSARPEQDSSLIFDPAPMP